MKRSLLAVLAVGGLLANACGNADDALPDSSTTLSPAITTPTSSSSATTATTILIPPTVVPTTSTTVLPANGDPSKANLSITVIATLDEPIAATTATKGGFWLAERGGRIVEFDPVSGAVRETILDISELTSAGGERGLLSIAVDFDHLYVSYTDLSGDSQIDAYQLDVDGKPGERRSVLHLDQPFSNHNGGGMSIGPDGFLYVAFGDGGSANDPLGFGQDTNTLLGSIIRIEPTPDGQSPYSIPDNNPYADGTGGRPEIFLTGVRNPWRFSFDSLTNDLWIGDVGQNRFEEVDLLLGRDGWGLGDNLGWNVREGSHDFRDGLSDDLVDPIFEYSHNGDPGGCSITGGVVYRGQLVPELFGAYLFGDFCTAHVWALSISDGVITFTDLGLEVPGGQLVSFGVDPDGEVLMLSLSGQVSRLGPADN